MIQLSYSTIKMVYEASHNWVNKQMGLKPEDKPYYHEGEAAHRAIQLHVAGKKINPDLVHIKYTFPVVEEKDFDPRCKFDITLKDLMTHAQVKPDAYQPKDQYNLIGFFDGHHRVEKNFLEIKSSGRMWTLKQFNDLIQRKIYSLVFPEFERSICIAALRDMDKWKIEKPKVFIIPMSQKDRNDALDWLLGGIKIIESGDYSGGLDMNGHCADPEHCYYGINCSFRKEE